MKAMILAAGLGTRMWPLSQLCAKAALPVLNRPLVHWTLEALRGLGVREVVINLHHRARSVVAAVGDGSAFGMRVRYSRERTILGSAGGVRKVRPWLGDEPFLLLNGDMVFDFEIERLVARQRETGARACVSLQPHPASGRYGSVRTDRKGRVLSFGGHPAGARGEPWHFTGIHVMDPALLDRLRPGYAETARDLYGPLIAEGGLVVGVHLRGPWYDLSSPQLYLASQVALLDKGFVAAPRRRLVAGDARVDPRARLSRSVVGQGARIGPGARVSESVLWDGARVEAGARVERAVVGSGARVPAGALARDLVLLRRTRATEGLPGIRDGQHWIEVKA